ncbi:HK97-gp10 family putative phage morphogenesis protein [Endobacterium cereale]|uniref:HK97 gp10 family phage protein n=1 Tax=Endobacterium cereale TaxID=2663029 RepID=UPI002B495C71|nr:HK97 gp10 family phage protein [Endobacterium cereale]MEB2845926.1 HK97 gp10 family phage protein [Endobacterium cereale]
MMSAQLKGRESLMRRLNLLAPNVEKYTAEAKLKAADMLADEIRARAPTGVTLDYMESLDGDLLTSRPAQERVNIAATKDPQATGIFARFIWRFLEFGTAPHSTAKGGGTVIGKKQALANKTGMHPGAVAQPHIFPTYRAMKPKIRRMILAAVNKAVREARRG